ncbi:CHAT domain-containing protein [Phellopilus nigrolimitatus]|nr:CHAT domain-containing protein [Phellopilus nigrolimitatus]
MEDLEEDIFYFRGTLDIMYPPGHPDRFAFLNDLGDDVLALFGQTGRMKDLEESISKYRDALELCPPGHPGRSVSLNNIANGLLTRFKQTGRMEDLEESIAHFRDALGLCPSGHPHRSSILRNLAEAKRTRFEQTDNMGRAAGRMEDLEGSISFHRDALDLLPPGHCHGSVSLNSQTEDLEESITLFRDALDLRPPGNPHRSSILRNLAEAKRTRFEQTGQVGDLEEFITLSCEALNLHPPGHPDRSASLDNMGRAAGRMEDLEGSISFHRDALDLLPPGHCHGSVSLNSQTEDLEESITLFRDALDLRPPGNPERSLSLHNLAEAKRTRFEQTGQMGDLEDSITLAREALNLYHPGNPYRFAFLNDLGNALHALFKQTGRMKDLKESIAHFRDALVLCPPGRPDRSVSLTNLANGMLTGFGQTGRMEDLEESIAHYRNALDLHPHRHPEHSSSLNNLGTGRMEDLEEMISLHRQALDLHPLGHPDRSACLNNLATATGWMEDLEQSISLHRDALDLNPYGHPVRSTSLSNLATALRARFEQTGQVGDNEESIALNRDALDLHPPGHPNRSFSLCNLATSVFTRFEQTGQMEDLKESITHFRDALDLRPPGHPNRSSSLDNLAGAMTTYFEQTGRMEDLKESIAYFRDAVILRPHGHPDRSLSLYNLAGALRIRFEQIDRMEDLEESLRIYEEGADHVFSNTLLRLTVAIGWARFARSQCHASTLRAYRVALSLLESSLVISPTVQMQHKTLSSAKNYPTLASDAASYAIEVGEVAQAVEMLEQGRALIWSQMRGLRTPMDQPVGVDEDLVNRFLDTSRKLESLATSSESKLTTLVAEDSLTSVSQKFVDEMYSRKRHLASQRDDIVANIRATSGFEDFLQPRRFSALQEAAVEGPVIIVSHSRYRSDAFIVLYDRPPVSIELDSKFDHDGPLLVKDLKTALEKVQREPNGCDADIRDVLGSLWDQVVSRVVEKLDELGIKKHTRIWWCPTSFLSSLPFHAAGPIRVVEGSRKYLSDDYISSYTPTLTALINARESKPGIRRHDIGRPQLLVVALPDESIPLVEKEYRAIRKDRDFVRCLVREQATCEAVIDNLRDQNWVHFACHGHLNPEEPFKHAFQLFGGDRLTLLDIIRSDLPNAEIAFLSACHSAGQIIDDSREEVLHLAAAMQFCGFRSVIGTMWAMADDDGPFVAKKFYECMLAEDSPEVAFKRSAKALHETIQRLRRRRGMTVERWVNFIHIGA